MRALVLATLLTAAPALAAPPPTEGLDLETIARDTARDLVDGKYDAVVARFSAEMAKAIGRDQVAAVIDPLRGERAPARSVIVRLRNDHPDGAATFTIKGNWTRGAVSDIQITVRGDGKVTGLNINDEAPPIDRLDGYETRAHLRPPFRGTWTAHNADRSNKNPHYTNRNQRFAVDWSIDDGHGKTYRGEGRRNEDYLAYGQDALAVAAGTVVLVVDGIPDNPAPGQKDGYFVPGNYVAIDLGGGEFALYCHLIPGSIVVRPGQKVAAGALVGKVGNSGNSSEPHLHFQLADKPRLAEARSLPCKFSDVLLDGKRVPRAWPVDGNRIAAPEGK